MVAIASHKADEFFNNRPTRKIGRKMKKTDNSTKIGVVKDLNGTIDIVANANI